MSDFKLPDLAAIHERLQAAAPALIALVRILDTAAQIAVAVSPAFGVNAKDAANLQKAVVAGDAAAQLIGSLAPAEPAK